MSNFVGNFNNALGFDASFLASKFGVFASKIAASKTPTEIISTESILGSGLSSLLNLILGFLFKLIFYICRFALNLVDFMEAVVNKLSGISSNESYDINKDFKGNPIFRFLLSDVAIRIFSIFIGVAILLLIVLVIIAIVKSDYDAATNDQEGAKGPIFRRAFKSLFLFLSMPIFLFVFILSSNAILNSVNAAFKSGGATQSSLGGTIFVSSTYEANKYRTYAESGERAPILFDFEDPAQTIGVEGMSPEELRDAYGSWTNAREIYNSFAYRKFDDAKNTVVYRNGKFYNSSSFAEYENFVTTPEEYYVLADFIDYAVTNALEYYIKPMNDADLDWEAVKNKIGTAMYYSIINDMSFSIGYKDVFNIDGDSSTKSYIKEYVNSVGAASTPIADAVRAMEMILAIGDYSDNTFKVLESVPGYVNYVRWASEKAMDEATGEIMRVYEITKYTYNTLIEEIQEREPQLCVQYNGAYYAVQKLSAERVAENGGQYSYICDTDNDNTKVDRVSVDHKFLYDNGEEYLNQYGEAIMLPKDKLSIKFRQASWPEKLYNDLLVVFGDVFRALVASDGGDWMDMQITSSGATVDASGSVIFPSAFITPAGLVMSELFLGTRTQQVEGAAASATYGTIYSDTVLNSIIKTVAGEENYKAIKAQIEVYETIFDNMMAAILDDAAEREGVSDVDDSVSINTYKQYLSSIMMSEEFATYFGLAAKTIVGFNEVLYEMNKNSEIPAYSTMTAYSAVFANLLNNLDDDSLAKTMVESYYVTDDTDTLAFYSETSETKDPVGDYEGWNSDFYRVRSAENISFAGQDIEKLYSELKTQRDSAYNSYKLLKQSKYLEQLRNYDEQIYSLYKYVLKSSFRDAITNITTNNIDITFNDITYHALLTLSTTQIAEYAFGGQLKTLIPDFYDSDEKFLYVDPEFPGIMTVSDFSGETTFSAPFAKLRDFVKKFGDIAIALNSSNFSSMAFGAVEHLKGEAFETAFANYIKSELLTRFPDIARTSGLVTLEDLGLSSEAIANVVSWKIVGFDKTNNTFSAMVKIADGNNQPSDKEKSYKLSKDNAVINKTIVEFWGMEYHKSEFGFVYDLVDIDASDNVVYAAIIDGIRYPIYSVDYSELRADNSVVVSAEDKDNIYSGFVINFLNGKKYLVDNDKLTVTIGAEEIGKTLVDYRRDAFATIADLDTRAGETDVELQDRFLSMLYLMSAGEIEIEANKYVISTEIFSKTLVKRLAGEENRPDENLVEKVYGADFEYFAKDEDRGTVFVICTYDKSTEKFVPYLTSTDTTSLSEFASPYVVNPYGTSGKMYYPLVARGVIDGDGNPTAIRMKQDGTIEFYRDNIYVVNASNLNLSMYYQSLEDVRVKKSVVSTIVNGITKVFTGKTLTQMVLDAVPRLSADATLNFAFGSERTIEAAAQSGKFEMSYNFKTLGIDYFYSTRDINIIIFLFGTILIFGAIVAAMWGLIQRVLDITVLFIVSPPIIASIPISSDDKNGRFVTWRNKMISSVLSVYGIVIGLNIFFIFVPFINQLNIVNESSAIVQVGLGRTLGAPFINYLFRVVFLFTAIGLIRRAPAMFQPMISGGSDQDIFSKGEATRQNISNTIATVKDHISGQYMHDKLQNLAGTAKGLIPGMAIAKKVGGLAKKGKDFVAKKAAYFAARKNGVPKNVAKQAAKDLGESIKKARELEEKEKARRQEALEKRESDRAERMAVPDEE